MLYAVPPLRMARLRFEMRPLSTLAFPPGRRGEVLYGAFGTILRRAACDASCRTVASCPRRGDCVYAKLFEPAAQPVAAPGENGARKAFLFRLPPDDAPYSPLRPLRFELRLFGSAIDSWRVFAEVFRRVAKTGLADREVELVSILSLNWEGTSARILFDDGALTDAQPIRLTFKSFFDDAGAPGDGRAVIDFLSPVLLKDRRSELRVPTLGALIRRLRDRISLLSLAWAGEEWQADYGTIGEIAEAGVTETVGGGWSIHNRHSTRTKRDMPVEGFLGTVTFAGVAPELWPLLRIGAEVHVGQHAVWGNGHYRIAET